jgi:hypothetical protein
MYKVIISYLKKFGMKGAHPIIDENNNSNDSSEVIKSLGTGRDTHNHSDSPGSAIGTSLLCSSNSLKQSLLQRVGT